MFQNFHQMIQTQICILKTNNGKEYFSQIWGRYLKKNNIVHQMSYIGTLQQNGVLKRKNRHLLEVAQALMFKMRFLTIFGEKQCWQPYT